MAAWCLVRAASCKIFNDFSVHKSLAGFEMRFPQTSPTFFSLRNSPCAAVDVSGAAGPASSVVPGLCSLQHLFSGLVEQQSYKYRKII